MSGHFHKQADYYARYRPTYPEEMYNFLLEKVPEKNTAWDCGTGSGQVAVRLAQNFKQVYATDISREQLAHAPRQDNIVYKVATAEDSGLPARTFDLITVAQAIHWFDFESFYREVRRTATDNGLLAVIGYGMLRMGERADLLLDDFYEEMFGTYFTENRAYLDDAYRTIPFPFEEVTAPFFHIKYTWSLQELEGYLNSWSAVQKFKDTKKVNPVNDFIATFASGISWKENERKEVTFPVFLRLGNIH